MLHPLLISDSRVLVFQVSSVNTCVLSRGDSSGTMSLVSQTQHPTEVQSEEVQTTTFQSVWAISPQQVVKPRVTPADGAGAAAYVLLEGDNISHLWN